MWSRKGQVFTPDFSASIVLFSLFLIMFGVIWNSSMAAFLESGSTTEGQTRYALNILQTSGEPENWTSENVTVPGLYSEGRLSGEEFLDFKDIGVRKQRSLLRVQEFYLSVRYLNGSKARFNGRNLTAYTGPELENLGNFPENTSVYSRRDISVLKENGKRVELRFYTWDG